MRKYKHISYEERRIIEKLYNSKVPVNEISKIIGRALSSTYEELKKGYYMHLNTDYTYSRQYSADKAQSKTEFNNSAKGVELKVGNDYDFISFVEDMIINKKYSPQAVLGYIKVNKLCFKSQITSKATIYSYIDKGVFPNLSNEHLLRRKAQKQKYRHIVRTKKTRGTSIELRPLSASSRLEFGHWEMDSVIGTREKGQTLLVLTERKTRYEIIFRCKDKTSKSVVKAINKLERQYSALFPDVFKTITVDNGTEFSSYLALEKSVLKKKNRTKVYFCHPYSSWERGSNEIQNAFIRRFVPKGTKIETISDTRLKEIQEYINTYPREIFNFNNSKALFLEEIDKLKKI